MVLGIGGNAYYVPFKLERMLTVYIRATIWELMHSFSLQPIPLSLEDLTMESVPHVDEEVSCIYLVSIIHYVERARELVGPPRARPCYCERLWEQGGHA